MWFAMVRLRLMAFLAYAQYDIFRLENEKMVEHWGNKEVMPKVGDLTNRGKF